MLYHGSYNDEAIASSCLNVASTQPCIPPGSLNRVPASAGRWGKGGNVTSAGWQVTLCDPMWHVMSSQSGVATLRTAIHLLLTCYGPVRVRPKWPLPLEIGVCARMHLIQDTVGPHTSLPRPPTNRSTIGLPALAQCIMCVTVGLI